MPRERLREGHSGTDGRVGILDYPPKSPRVRGSWREKKSATTTMLATRIQARPRASRFYTNSSHSGRNSRNHRHERPPRALQRPKPQRTRVMDRDMSSQVSSAALPSCTGTAAAELQKAPRRERLKPPEAHTCFPHIHRVPATSAQHFACHAIDSVPGTATCS